MKTIGSDILLKFSTKISTTCARIDHIPLFLFMLQNYCNESDSIRSSRPYAHIKKPL